jgi:hypothetical protein
MLDRVKYFRRRQFILGSEFIDYEGWQRLKLFDNFLLTLHPDLQITIVKHENNKAILLGYAIDPYQPELNDEEILQRFVTGEITINKVSDSLKTLSGRFVLIINCPQGIWLFHDACALRQVQYCTDEHGAVWCATQAETLAESFGFDYDEDILSYRNTSAVYQTNKEEFWLINDRSPYREIRNLLPNHYLDLRQGKAIRYWPVPDCIGSFSADKGIELSKLILQNSIAATAMRFDLKMGISAGCDSRKSLAAAKNVKDKIYFFTHTPQVSNEADMEIPEKLLPKLGIVHHKFDLQQMDADFKKYYECSTTWARERRGHIAYTALQHFGSEATILNSNISEYSQVWFWLPKSNINGEGLAMLKSLNHPLVISEFQKWLNGAQDACKKANMNILVLFDIELRARWVTAAIAEYDIAHETFNPYNNRHFFCLELSVNERIRRGRRLDYPIKLIKNMWPEVLREPINPEKNIRGKLQEFIWRSIIHKTITPWFPIVEYLRYLRLRRSFKEQAK